MQVVSGTPSGFEALQTPRPTSITVTYGGELLGTFAAHYTTGSVIFDAPEALLNAIPANINDKNAVLAALRMPLPANAGALCPTKQATDCGTLAPESVGIIFDENNLAAELFINRKWLALSDDSGPRYLPLPAHNFSSVYNVAGAVSGDDASRPAFTLTNNAVYALGENALTTQSTLTNDGVRFDTLSANVERNGWNSEAGLMRSVSSQLIGDHDIAGVSVATSMRTRLDAHKIEGNDIILYLPRRAFVSIYREGRLYSSRSYDAGNQRIDTSELPDGAYPITLKIEEGDGQTREETRFFTKSQDLPPPDAPTWYAQAGMVRAPASNDSTLPVITDAPIARLGTVQRISDNLGLSLGGTGFSDRAALESGLFMVNGNLQARTTLLASSAGDAGVQGNLLYNKDGYSAVIDMRKIWAADKPLPTAYDNLIAKLTQATLSLSYMPKPDITLGLRASYASNNDATSTMSAGPYMDWQLWQQRESSLHLSADVARINDQTEGTLLLRFTYHTGHYTTTGEGGADFGAASHGLIGSSHVAYEDTTPQQNVILGAGAHADSVSRSVSADGDWRNNFGRIQGTVQQSFSAGNTLSYGSNFTFGAAQAQDALHVGGIQTDMSAIIIDASGDSDDTLTILVNGMAHGTVRANQRRVLYLPPYNIYRIALQPEHAGLIHIEGGERNVTLYAGTVAHLAWEVNRFHVVVGRVVTANNMPLANAMLKESRDGVVTDDKGRFQAELTHPGTLTFIRDNAVTCVVTLPANKEAVEGVMLYREPLRCLGSTTDHGAPADPWK